MPQPNMPIQPDAMDLETLQAQAAAKRAQRMAESEEDNAAAHASGDGDLHEQTGRSDPQADNGVPTEPPKPRDVADIMRDSMAEINRNRDNIADSIMRKRREASEALAAEMGDDASFGDEGIDNSQEAGNNQAQEEGTTAAQAAPVQQDAAPAQDEQLGFFNDENGQQMARLLVNGKIEVVPANVALAQLQKLHAGDERLRLAAEREKQLNQQLQQPPQHQPSTDAASVEQRKVQLRETLEKVVNLGDEESMDALVEQLAQGTPQQATPQLTPQDVARIATQAQRDAAWSTSVDTAERALFADPLYNDVTGNEFVYGLVAKEAGELSNALGAKQAGINPRDIMNLAAENIRNKLGLAPAVQPVAQQQPTTRAQAVQQRVQTMGTTVQGGSGARTVSQSKPAQPDGGLNPTSRDARLNGFAQLKAARENPTKR